MYPQDSTAYEKITGALKAHGSRKSGYDWQCPIHGDRNPSMTVRVREGTGAWVFCHSCGKEATPDIMAALGLTMADLYDNPLPKKVSPVRQEIAVLREWAMVRPWEGRAKERDRNVYLAILARGHKANEFTVHYGLREMGPDAGVGKDAASSAARKLSKMDLIRLGAWQPGDEARNIEIIPGVSRSQTWPYVETNSPLRQNHVCFLDTDSPGHRDFYRTEGAVLVGPKGLAIMAALTEEPQSAREIAGQLGISPTTASKYLRGVLSSLGVAVTCQDTRGQRWVRGCRQLDTYDPDTESMRGPILAPRLARYDRESAGNRDYWAIRRGKKKDKPVPVDTETGEKLCCMRCCGNLHGIRHQMGEAIEHVPAIAFRPAERGIAVMGEPYKRDMWFCSECDGEQQEWEAKMLAVCLSCCRQGTVDGKTCIDCLEVSEVALWTRQLIPC